MPGSNKASLNQDEVDELCKLVANPKATPAIVQCFLDGFEHPAPDDKFTPDNSRLNDEQRHSQHNTRPVDFAAQSGNPAVLAYLIEELGVSLDYQDENSNILQFARQNDDEMALAYLLFVPDLVLRLHDGTTQFHLDVLQNNWDKIKETLEKHPEKYAETNDRNLTVLYWASQHPDLQKELIAFGKQSIEAYLKTQQHLPLANVLNMFAYHYLIEKNYPELYIYVEKAYECYIAAYQQTPSVDILGKILNLLLTEADLPKKLCTDADFIVMNARILRRLIDATHFLDKTNNAAPFDLYKDWVTELLVRIYNRISHHAEMLTKHTDKFANAFYHQEFRSILEATKPFFQCAEEIFEEKAKGILEQLNRALQVSQHYFADFPWIEKQSEGFGKIPLSKKRKQICDEDSDAQEEQNKQVKLEITKDMSDEVEPSSPDHHSEKHLKVEPSEYEGMSEIQLREYTARVARYRAHKPFEIPLGWSSVANPLWSKTRAEIVGDEIDKALTMIENHVRRKFPS